MDLPTGFSGVSSCVLESAGRPSGSRDSPCFSSHILSSRMVPGSLADRGLHYFQGLHPRGGKIGSRHRRDPKTSFSSGHGNLGLEVKLVFELNHSWSQNGAVKGNVTNSSEPSSSSTSTKRTNGLAKVLEIPKSIWHQVVQPLSNFGVGKSTFREGGVGLFLMSGVLVLTMTLMWVKGTQIRARSKKYEAVMEFAQAQGITVGTPVNIRGVSVGNVVRVRPSLQRIDVVVELVDAGIVIPRNALVEVNRSGLMSETLIDVTPRLPLPNPTVGPLDAGCPAEGLIVCDRERIKGEQGVSLDELIGICTKMARQMDEMSVSGMYDMAERMGMAVEDVKPLLAKVELMADDFAPLLKEVKEGGLLKDLENLTRIATQTGHDLRKLNKSVLTSENTEMLRESVSTLSKTLKHIESISESVSGLTGDSQHGTT